VGDNEWRTRHKTTTDLPESLEALIAGNEMKCQQADGAVEWLHRRCINVTLMKANSRGMRSGDLLRHPKHVGRWVNAGKRPTGVIVGESLQLQTATRTDDQNPPV